MHRNLAFVVVCGALILSLSMGVRQSFGLFLGPMTGDLDMARGTFAFAMAVQQILWGLSQPLTGMAADRFGSIRTVLAGTAFYVLGLVLMSGTTDAFDLNLGAGACVGFGAAGTGFAVVLGAVGRLVEPARRSMALGIASAGGSFGQFFMAPVGQTLIDLQGWSGALVSMAVIAVLMAPLAIPLRGRAADVGEAGVPGQTLREALAEAFGHGGYRYLTLGFFVCGFQVMFVAVHLPAYLQDIGLSAGTGATALALIGFFNIIGTYGCGALGGRYPKKYLLSGLYFLRAIVFAVFLALPKTEVSVLVFAAALGLLWLGTVPLTSGLVAHIFGARYMASLFGVVFFSHQVGSFLGVWLGGRVFDATGAYDAIWWASVALGVVAALLHLPITEVSLREREATG